MLCLTHRHRETRSTAFTLVELLVVVSIVALLIGILLPVLGSARVSGRTIICASNARQLAIANIAYAIDHDTRYVSAAANFAANLDRWHGQRDRDTDPFDPERGPLWPYFEVQELKQCPEFVSDEDYQPGFEAGNGGYGYNQDYVGSEDVSDVFTVLGAPADWFKKPSETVMFTDAAFSESGPLIIEYSFCRPPNYSSGSYSPSIHFRHQRKANTAWLDGHVDAQPLDWTRHNNAYGVSEAENRALNLGWFGPTDNTLFDRE